MLICCDFLASASCSIFSFSVDKKHCLSLKSCHIVHCYDMVYRLYLLRENFCLFLWGFAWVLWNIMPWNLWLLGSLSVTAWATHVWATQAAAFLHVVASHYFCWHRCHRCQSDSNWHNGVVKLYNTTAVDRSSVIILRRNTVRVLILFHSLPFPARNYYFPSSQVYLDKSMPLGVTNIP